MKVGMISLLNTVDAGKTFLLKSLSVFEGGKAPGNHILLGDPTVAFNHFRICRNDAGYVLYDQGSRNGTLVNGEKFENVVLQSGDLIRAGGVELRFDLVDSHTPGRLASSAPEIHPVSVSVTVPPGVGPSSGSDTPDFDVAVATAIRNTSTENLSQKPHETAVLESDQMAVQAVGSSPEKEVPSAAFMVIEGDDRGKTIPMTGKVEYVIGRSAEADGCLRDSKISRMHCKVNVVGNHFIVSDNGSSNGTIVNGERVKKTVLKNGDYVRLGFSILRFDTPSGE